MRVNWAGQADKSPMRWGLTNGTEADWTLMECWDKEGQSGQTEAPRTIGDRILAGQTLDFRLCRQQVRLSEESCLGWHMTWNWNVMLTQLEHGTFGSKAQQNQTTIMYQETRPQQPGCFLSNLVSSDKEITKIREIELYPKHSVIQWKIQPNLTRAQQVRSALVASGIYVTLPCAPGQENKKVDLVTVQHILWPADKVCQHLFEKLLKCACSD